jgi:hypothetical protein
VIDSTEPLQQLARFREVDGAEASVDRGKERKGKEKERKGKERKGKERKGKEKKRKERGNGRRLLI